MANLRDVVERFRRQIEVDVRDIGVVPASAKVYPKLPEKIGVVPFVVIERGPISFQFDAPPYDRATIPFAISIVLSKEGVDDTDLEKLRVAELLHAKLTVPHYATASDFTGGTLGIVGNMLGVQDDPMNTYFVVDLDFQVDAWIERGA